ncbi:MAG: twin arginine-targeting protein translocase TatC [Planctomycetes bacterium RBG_16_59_8]|nr:MAG: twin arginine-targeting protein translocase TatC [Planctomycetes bacterium RBG_16_59_8]
MKEPMKKMSFGDHLEELRRRIIRSVIALLLVFVACLLLQEELFHIVMMPHEKAMAGLVADNPSVQGKLVQLTYTATFFAYLKLSMIAALFIASPYIAYQLWQFVSAGLFPREKRYVQILAPISFLLFIGGCLFGYYLMIPSGLSYLAGYSPSLVTPMISVSEYLNLVLILTIVMGVVFEIPLAMLLLSAIGLIRPATYGKWRKFSIVFMFIAAAVITPTGDPINQTLVAVPMIILYEMGIILAKIFVRTPQ